MLPLVGSTFKVNGPSDCLSQIGVHRGDFVGGTKAGALPSEEGVGEVVVLRNAVDELAREFKAGVETGEFGRPSFIRLYDGEEVSHCDEGDRML